MGRKAAEIIGHGQIVRDPQTGGSTTMFRPDKGPVRERQVV